jgi:phospholipid/cholesterol/gamma-HCH transport system permease protein
VSGSSSSPAPSAGAATSAPLAPLRWLGARTISFVRAWLELLALLYGALVSPLYARRRGARVVYEATVMQTLFTGVHAIPLVGLAALAVGTLIVFEANEWIPVEYAPPVAAHILANDVAPLLVAVIILGRSGTAITVELAAMKLSGELDALRSMGLALEHAIVFPRLVAGVVSSLVLTTLALAVSLAGGHLVTEYLSSVPFSVGALLNNLDADDLSMAGAKAVLFGTSIVLVAVREGYSVQTSRRELPQAATRCVVRGLALCFVLNSVLSVVL